MSTLSTTNLKNPSSTSNNIVLATDGDTTITNDLTVSGTGTNSIAGTFQFNSGYGSVATAYGCRAWVNFNGTSTVAIRASGNVSSITDNGTGAYTINFTTAMPDTNYAAVGMVRITSGASVIVGGEIGSTTWQQTGSVDLRTLSTTFSSIDAAYVNVVIFR